MKRISLSSVCGVLVILVSTGVIIGWLFHINSLTAVISGYVSMPFNGALCFLMSGIAILSLNQPSIFCQRKLPRYLGAVIFTLALLILSQTITGRSLGIDQLIVKVQTFDTNPYPGRIPVNGAVSFIMVSIVLMLMPVVQKKWMAILVQSLIFIIFFVGLTSLLAYLLQLNFLYGWYRYSQMAIHAALSMVLVAIGLDMAWMQQDAYNHLFQHQEDKKIVMRSGAMMFTAVYVALVIGFAVSAQESFNLLQNSLQKSLQNEANVFLSETSHAQRDVESMLIVVGTQLSQHPSAAHLDMDELKAADFSYIAVYNQRPALVYQLGQPIQDAVLKTPVNLPTAAEIAWKNSWFLHYDLKVMQDGQQVGRVVADWPFSMTNAQPLMTHLFGDSFETLICFAKDSKQAQCFPSQLTPHPFMITLQPQGRPPIAMYFALSGKQGIINTIDYRGQPVIAAYSPIGQLGLGIVNKVDTLDLYHPISEGILKAIAMLTFTLLVCMLIIYFQIRPLVQRVVRSERLAKEAEAKVAYQASHDALTGLVNRPQLEYDFNRALASAKRNKQLLAVLFLDLDYFKQINDKLGHDAGDLLLQQMAQRLHQTVRATDIVSRIGGDEFVLVFTDLKSEEHLIPILKKIMASISKPMKLKNKEITVTPSIGVSLYPKDGSDFQTLIQKADAALYVAKGSGRNKYQFAGA